MSASLELWPSSPRRAGPPSRLDRLRRKVVELLPDIDWNKGRALRWLLEQAGLTDPELVPVYAGDDYTDEDALQEVHDEGLGVVVLSPEHGDRLTWAHVSVAGTGPLIELLSRLAGRPR